MHAVSRSHVEAGETRGWPTSASDCLTEEQVLGFAEGKLTRASIAQIDSHLNDCQGCNLLVLEVLRQGAANAGSGIPHPRSRCWTFEPGSRIAARYLVRRSLGRGGMGEVYEVFDIEDRRTLAIKTTLASRGDQPEATLRLSSEASLARRVFHPNVCRVHEVGVHQDSRPHGGQLGFMSMDYIDGQSLAQRLQAGSIAPCEVQGIARELFRGIAAIHRSHVIHRDVKSHNVMLRSESGRPSLVIIDFGLAIDTTGELSDEPLSVGRASPFSFEGSPAYMAPEQFLDVPSTPAMDIFACGVVLFEALTRTLPFRSLRPERKRTYRDPSEVPLRATAINPSVPQSLDAFIARCLELDPAQRFASAELALAEIQRMPTD